MLAVGSLRVQIGGTKPLYPDGDVWVDYLAPESACPGGEDGSAATERQLRAMVCLVNWARARRELRRLAVSDALTESAMVKASDIRLCEDFSHDACGQDANQFLEDSGWDGAGWGENLFMGTRELGRPRVALDRWLNSSRHREILFDTQWTELGVALTRFSVEGQSDIAVWVAHFGRR